MHSPAPDTADDTFEAASVTTLPLEAFWLAFESPAAHTLTAYQSSEEAVSPVNRTQA